MIAMFFPQMNILVRAIKKKKKATALAHIIINNLNIKYLK